MAFGGSSLDGEVGQLRFSERVSPGIGKKPVKNAGQVLKMKTGRGDPGGTLPKQGIRKIRHQFIDLQFRLQKSVSDRL